MTAQRRLLLVEGPADREVILHLCNAYQINSKEAPSFVVKPSGGSAPQRVELTAALAAAILGQYDAVGVIADADENASVRWTSLRDVLVRNGYEPPLEWPAEGWIGRAEGMPIASVWIMGAPTGALEDHLASTVAPEDALLQHATRAVDTAPQDPRRFTDTHRAKAVAFCFLALCEPPGAPLGVAITRRLFDPHHPANVALVDWLRQTFA